VTGAVLLQKKEDGKKHPIAYYSKTLSAAERNYDIYDLELLAIVNALDHWRPYLAGSPHKVIIYSDHQNLLYWKEPHKISRQVAREVLMLSEYNFEIRHIKGTANRRVDALSRHPDYDQGQNDNQDVTVLPEQVFIEALEVINEHAKQNEDTLKAWVDPHQLKKHQNIWYKDRRQVVTGGIEAKRHLIQSHHDSPVYGHPGISKTIQLTERLYLLRFAKRGPTWTRIMWMQPLMTQLWSSDTRYSNTRSPLYVRRHNSTSTKIER
jgi:hypothetical protein